MAEDEMAEVGMELDANGRWAMTKTTAQVAFYAKQSAPKARKAA
jgi:hypothetical protein